MACDMRCTVYELPGNAFRCSGCVGVFSGPADALRGKYRPGDAMTATMASMPTTPAEWMEVEKDIGVETIELQNGMQLEVIRHGTFTTKDALDRYWPVRAFEPEAVKYRTIKNEIFRRIIQIVIRFIRGEK